MSFPLFFRNSNCKYISMAPCDFVLNKGKNATFINEIVVEPKSTIELLKTSANTWINTAFDYRLSKARLNGWRRVIIQN